MAAETHVNGGQAALAADITTTTQTALTIASGDVGKLPSTGPYRLHLTDGTQHELVQITAGFGTANLTMVRTIEAYAGSSTPQTFVGASTTAYEVLTYSQLQALPGGAYAPSEQYVC